MSRYNAGVAEWCSVCSASVECCALIEAALDGEGFTVHAATVELREEAVAALESCRRYDCPEHRSSRATDDAIELLEERACARCHVYVAGESLVDAEAAPLSGLVCDDCDHEIMMTSHGDETCTCSSCDRTRSLADRIARAAEASARGGIRQVGLELLAFTEEELS